MQRSKKNARRALESGRANDQQVYNSLARAVLYTSRKYDRSTDAPEEWERGCMGFAVMLCVTWAVGVMWGVIA